jgi:hypothetical protein
MSTQPPMPPINTDPKRAVEQAISALREIVKQRPVVRQIFDCEAFIKYELEGALGALSAESAIRTNFHGNVSLIDGIPHRPCDCPKDQGKCARGFPRTLLTTEFSRCMVPV